MLRGRLFWRLFLAWGLLILGTCGLLGMFVAQRVQEHALGQITESLKTKAILVREVVRSRQEEGEERLQQQMVALRREIATRITLIAADGRVVADSEEDPAHMDNHGTRPEIVQASTEGLGRASRFSATLQEPMLYVAVPVDAGRVRFVRVALPLDRVRHELAEIRRLIWTAAGLLATGALLVAFALSRRMTRPLRELQRSAEQITAGRYGHKVYVPGQDECAALAQAFNRMSERLAEQFAQLAEDREQLRMILGGMIEGVIALDAEQRILFANARAAELLAFSPAEATGRKLWEVVRRRALQEVVEHALASGSPQREELTWNGPNPRSLTVHAARLAGSPPRGAVLVLHDTTDLRRLERLRQDFVANVSHELKTPLAVIKACAETLLDGALEDAEHRGAFLQRIADQAERLHTLILDLLSLARIESGEELFTFREVSLAAAVNACLERQRARADAKNQQLAAVPPADPRPVLAWADEEALAHILDNLVDNAIKYTPAGGRITVHWGNDGDWVFLEVTDTGIGIPEQDLPRIFERFYRVDKARSRELGGTGLGLAIVKHLVQALGGSVTARSQLGQGSTFRVRLPRPPAS